MSYKDKPFLSSYTSLPILQDACQSYLKSAKCRVILLFLLFCSQIYMDTGMRNSFFQFKQFRVYQDRCAMKVGTDGVLLGAWCNVSSARRVLDVGTGTGLIALMVAQRSSRSLVDAVEIDEDAARQASENVALSEWKDRITVCGAVF